MLMESFFLSGGSEAERYSGTAETEEDPGCS